LFCSQKSFSWINSNSFIISTARCFFSDRRMYFGCLYLPKNTSQLQVNVSAEEVGAKEKSSYHSYTCGDISSSSLSHIIR
jgi:hypothetical protein